MAFGFIKKIFSFGKKQVEEVPAEGEAPETGHPSPRGEESEAAATGPSSPPRGEGGSAAAAPGEGAGAAAPQPALPSQAPAGIGPAQPREIPETPQTPERPSVDEAPPDHPRPDLPGKPEPTPERVEKRSPKLRRAEAEPEKPAEPERPAPQPERVPEPREPTVPPPAPEKPEKPAEPERRPGTPPETPPQPEPEVPPAPPPRPVPPEPARPPPEVPPAKPPDEIPPSTPPETPPAPPQEIPVETPPQEVPPAPAPQEVPAPQPPIEIPPPPSPPRGEGGSATAGPGEGARAPAPHAGGRVSVSRSVERVAPAAPPPETAQPKTSWLQRLRSGLSRSSKELTSSISGVLTKRRLDEDTLQDLEDILIRADLGAETAMRIADTLSAGRFGRDVSDQEVRGVMASEIEKVLTPVAQALELDLSHKPHVILVVGVNGTGKTTTIGKLAAKLVSGGLSVTLAAGDTFRAAAIEQLNIWGERTGSPVVASKLGADAAGLAWDAYEKAKEAGSDVLIIDTAGRLQNKAELMAELEKIVRVLGKRDPEAPHTVLQTVDATTGQNALNQVEIFRNVAGVNGIVMTKLDGTARGGILVAIAAKHKLPVYFIGVGEQVDDLEPFSAGDFAAAIAGTETT